MSGHALVLNAGSSSLKFALYALDAEPKLLLTGLVERIGEAPALSAKDAAGAPVPPPPAPPGVDHQAAVAQVLSLVSSRHPEASIDAVGHRVVHGGPHLEAPTLVDDAVLAELERLEPFAPLHQPHNLAGIRAARAAFPTARQIACFDTAFHRNHPWVNDVFALPREYIDKGVRRYGFHGLSYDYVSGELSRLAPDLHSGRVVVAHLGNGASMCGMLAGRSVGSTMGFSALDGLPMGTRSGQLDPGVLLYLMEQEGLSAAEISDLLYRRSGLLGLSGLSNDMRTLEAADTPEARQAIDYFVFRIRRELGALAAVLGGLDAFVFCGGIGENSAMVRRRVCEGMAWLGIEMDADLNARGDGRVSADDSRVRVLVVPTDEEIVIARAAAALMRREAAA
ncbi:MAG: acetate/propionate family kinase [Pseudomonadota bacterium]